MKLLLEPDLSSYTDAAYEADLQLLPAQRRDKALKYRFPDDRKRCVRAYMLLWEGLRQEYGITDAPVFDFEPNGKPFLSCRPDVHFSLSHTRNAVLCALDNRPIGADIEMIALRGLDHLLSVLSTDEREAVEQASNPSQQFLQIWTRKESYLKLTGEGLTGPRTLQSIPTADTDAVYFETTVCQAKGFVYSICQWKKEKVPVPDKAETHSNHKDHVKEGGCV